MKQTIHFRKLVLMDDMKKGFELKRKVASLVDAQNAFNTVLKMDILPEEIFAAIFLDCKLNINGIVEISHGTLDSSCVTMRELFKNALLYNTHSFIVAHNHPSGDTTPSSQDKSVTQHIEEAAQIMGIHFHDHVIIGNGQYFSFADHNLLKCEILKAA